MLSSIHAFSVELRLASESVLSKVKYVVYKDKNRLLFVVLLPTTSRLVREKFTMQIRTGRKGGESARARRDLEETTSSLLSVPLSRAFCLVPHVSYALATHASIDELSRVDKKYSFASNLPSNTSFR